MVSRTTVLKPLAHRNKNPCSTLLLDVVYFGLFGTLIRQYGLSLISCCYGNEVCCPRVRREVLGAGRMLSRRRAEATEDDDQ
jgi:hypothetical protein